MLAALLHGDADGGRPLAYAARLPLAALVAPVAATVLTAGLCGSAAMLGAQHRRDG